ncbi:hypothetical protein DPM19_01400 [Actinomadura craniellae]|uniref:Uncharacterized protein n=1 Tax=Actinomadura craniellae TaxID=2231787 RepID=A0A365HCI0_9ACTN|nr:hypothetical protein [Actinomadura craniellae]RAY16850.1 hypothetical protein DPM19_01400 [Actinomadura craniellae]
MIVDAAGRPALDPVEEILRVLGLGPDTVEESRAWIRPGRAGGWHIASGLPKPDEIVVERGSVVVLHLKERPERAALRRLATEGIGLRRIEGFGTVEVNPAPWRQDVPAPAAPARQPSVLAALRERELLGTEETVRWLLDRGRRVAVERARNPRFGIGEFFEERISLLFDDRQAAAVRELFESDRLAAALPLLERELDLLTTDRGDPS